MIHLLISILGILFTIFFVIGTHEAAHFFMARILGIKVLRFSIGFGKALWHRYDKSGTEYVIAMIPLGGYVQMLDENETKVSSKELHLAYNRQPFYKKVLVIMAGPLANIFCAFILYWLVFMIGFKTIIPVTGDITPRSIAAEAGLKPNQEILSIDDKPIITWSSVIFRIVAHAGNQDHLKIVTENFCSTKRCQSNKQTYLLDLSNWHMNELMPDPLKSLGITPYQADISRIIREIKYSPLDALSHANQTISNFIDFNLLIFGKLLTGKLSLQSLGGPIIIFQSAGNALNYGLLPFMSFLAFLSISIGIINLLPIPGLDGGHLLIQIIESILRKPLPEAVLHLFYRAGLLFILFLLIQAIVNDILRLY